MNKKLYMSRKLYLQLVLYPIILIIISSTIITIYHILEFIKNGEDRIANIKIEYILEKKENSYSDVHNTLANIKLIKQIVIKDENKLNLDSLQNNIIKTLEENINLNSTDDLFIVKLNNINGGEKFAKVLYSKDKNIVGKILSDNTSKTKFRKDILKQLRDNGEVYHEYFSHDIHFDESKIKHVYIYYYEPLKIVIGSGFYIKDLNTEIERINLKVKESIKLEIISSIIVTTILLVFMLILLYFNTQRIIKMLKEKEDEIQNLNHSLQDKVLSQIEEIRLKDLMLAQKSKSEAMGQMMSMITHQWRQPLNAINSITAKIYIDSKKGKLNDNNIVENIHDIEELTQYLSQTITDFSSFYKPSMEKEKFFIHEVVQNSLNILFSRYYDGIKPNIEFYYTQKITLCAYKTQIQQIIITLLNNSIENFKIRDIKDSKIIIDIKKVNNRVYINIQDNGKGIEEDNIDKIFDLYYTTKNDTVQSRSNGMGLYIAKMITKTCLNGDISAKNVENGVIFTISCDLNETI